MQKATGQLAKTHEARRVRREIARVNTLLGRPQAGVTK
jgi:large subunit ribosomal protein L29